MFREAYPAAPPSAPRLRGGLLPALLLAALLCLVPMRARAQNYLHTSGTKIVDSKGNVVRLTGLNWFGLETSTYSSAGTLLHICRAQNLQTVAGSGTSEKQNGQDFVPKTAGTPTFRSK